MGPACSKEGKACPLRSTANDYSVHPTPALFVCLVWLQCVASERSAPRAALHTPSLDLIEDSFRSATPCPISQFVGALQERAPLAVRQCHLPPLRLRCRGCRPTPQIVCVR